MKLFSKTEKDDNRAEMPFLDHLEELRWRVIKSVLSILIITVVSFFFSEYLFELLLIPANRLDPPLKLQAIKVQTPFMILLEIAFIMGIVLSIPVIFYQAWKFVSPGLLKNEKSIVPALAMSALVCFLLGTIFSYYIIIPNALRFFRQLIFRDLSGNIDYNISLDEYLSFILRLILVFGVIFLLPILSFILTRIGLLTPKFMRKYRRYAIVLSFILGAILTPPDVITQIFLAIPLIILYEFSIFISYIFSRKDKKIDLQT